MQSLDYISHEIMHKNTGIGEIHSIFWQCEQISRVDVPMGFAKSRLFFTGEPFLWWFEI